MTSRNAIYRMLYSPFSHRSIIYAPCLPPKISHFACIQFLLDNTVVQRVIEDNGSAKLGGKQGALWSRWKMVNKCISITS